MTAYQHKYICTHTQLKRCKCGITFGKLWDHFGLLRVHFEAAAATAAAATATTAATAPLFSNSCLATVLPHKVTAASLNCTTLY